jgi:glutamyl-tRNA synthetase
VATVVLLDEQTAQSILSGLRASFKESYGWNERQILQPIRAALTGATSGPPLPEIMGLIGKERTLQRLGTALRNYVRRNT